MNLKKNRFESRFKNYITFTASAKLKVTVTATLFSLENYHSSNRPHQFEWLTLWYVHSSVCNVYLALLHFYIWPGWPRLLIDIITTHTLLQHIQKEHYCASWQQSNKVISIICLGAILLVMGQNNSLSLLLIFQLNLNRYLTYDTSMSSVYYIYTMWSTTTHNSNTETQICYGTLPFVPLFSALPICLYFLPLWIIKTSVLITYILISQSGIGTMIGDFSINNFHVWI